MRLGNLDKIRADHRRRRIAPLVKKFLPLPDHPQETIVDDGDIYLDALLKSGGKLSLGHLETAVPDNCPNISLRTGKLCSNGSRQSKTHRPQPSRGDQRIWSFMPV